MRTDFPSGFSETLRPEIRLTGKMQNLETN